jgi:hypothetical protein
MRMTATLLLLTSLAMARATPRGPEPVAPVLDQAYSTRVNRRARGLGFGLRQGLWGPGNFAQSLHLDIPFGRVIGQFFGMRVHATFVHPPHDTPGWDPTLFGGVELFGRSPVIGGVVRIYGGGGLFVGGRPLPTSLGRHWGISGGGHMGIEAFAAPMMSFSVEVGGQGNVHALGYDAGPSVMGGINFYFGR